MVITRSPMRSLGLGRGSPDCEAGVEIPGQRCRQTSPKLAQLIVSYKFTVIRPGPDRLPQHLLSSCWIHLLDYIHPLLPKE